MMVMHTHRKIVLSVGLLLCAVAGVFVAVTEQESDLLFYSEDWDVPFFQQPPVHTQGFSFWRSVPANTVFQQCKTLPVQTQPELRVGFSAPIRQHSSAKVVPSCVAVSPVSSWQDANIVAPPLSSPSEQTYNSVLPSLQRSRIVADGALGMSVVGYNGISTVAASSSSAVRHAPVLGGDVGSVWQQWLDEYYATGATDLSGLEAWWQSNYGSGYTPDIYTEFAKWAMPMEDSLGFCLLLTMVYVLWKRIKRCVQ